MFFSRKTNKTWGQLIKHLIKKRCYISIIQNQFITEVAETFCQNKDFPKEWTIYKKDYKHFWKNSPEKKESGERERKVISY